MSSVIYLLRSKSEGISPSLYQNKGSALVIAIDDSPLPGKVVKTVSECPYSEREQLSYEQLLGVLVESKRVVTL